MTQNYGETASSATATDSPSGKADAAKQEAAEVASTAREEAGDVLGTAQEEAANVAHEARAQAKEVYAQTRQELMDQAAQQQRRVAKGLRAIGDELQSMARGAENPGIGADLVGQASTRVSDASEWLSQRDPGGLVNEVKAFARRKPGVFIGGALVAGVLAGRLTRSLAESASEHGADDGSPRAGSPDGVATRPTPPVPPATTVPPQAPVVPPTTAAPGAPGVAAGLDEPTPVYDSSRAASPAVDPAIVRGERADDR